MGSDLRDLLARREPGAPGRIDVDAEAPSAWTVAAAPMPPTHRRVWESLTTSSEGPFGVRGLGDAGGSPSWPAHVVAGVFDHRHEVPELLRGPLWTQVHLEPRDGWTEDVELDLRAGIVSITLTHPDVDGVVVVRRWLSAADPGVGVLQVVGPPTAVALSEPLARPDRCDDSTTTGRYIGDIQTMSTWDERSGIGIAVSAHDHVHDERGARRIERVTVTAPFHSDSPDTLAWGASTEQRLRQVRREPIERLEEHHREEWARRWTTCGTSISGDIGLDRAVRFTTHHLLATGGSSRHVERGGAERAELAIGARGVTGHAYRGHVFWDADVFTVPALSAIAPDAARRALNYRWNRLGPALDAAIAEGRTGARFPWESAWSGRDVTPRWGTLLDGTRIPILTGDLEVHIVGDIAWSAWNHVRWTGDEDFWRRVGEPIVVETARYWASRIEEDDDGSAHIRRVIGPDEYHEDVDDNAFTNIIARHNLRLAAAADVDVTERRRWHELADALVDGYDASTRIYEQFRGYDALDPVLVESVGTPPLSADSLLGREIVQRTQISKQPDVLMAFHMVPHEMQQGALAPNVAHHLPRTAAGSSLAPAICASLLARVGDLDAALHWFELAARFDLDDLTGTTAGGLHLATMGGLWQAVTHGFLGVDVDAEGGALRVDPSVPPALGVLRHRFRFHDDVVTVTVDGDDAYVESGHDVPVWCGGQRTARTHPLVRRNGMWEHR